MTETTYAELKRRVEDLEGELNHCRRAEEALRRSQYYLDRMTRGMYESLLVLDRNFIIKDVNDRFLEEYGGTREDVIGRTCHEITHGSDSPCSGDEHACPVREVLETREPTRVEHIHKGHDGEELVIEIYGFPLFAHDGTVEEIVEVHHDVTDRKRAEKERAEREKMEGVLEMAGAVCHELNQPLGTLLLYCEQLTETQPKGSEMGRHIRFILEKIRVMSETTRKLQTIATYEAKDYAQGKRIIDIDKSSGLT